MIWPLPTPLDSPHILSSWYYLCPTHSLHTPLSTLAHPSNRIDLDRSLYLALSQTLLCHIVFTCLYLTSLLLHRPETGIRPHSLASTLRILLHFMILYIFAGIDSHTTAQKRENQFEMGVSPNSDCSEDYSR